MRSLELQNLEVIQGDLLKSATHLCIESDLVIYFADEHSIYCYNTQTREVSLCSHLDGASEDGISGGEIIQMDYIIETQNICLSNANGDIITYNTISNEIECVGSVSSGLHAVAWSPDQEFLVLLTGENTFVLMTKEFDPIVEKYLHPSEFGEYNPINVGWGSKETQFQGSVGKGAAKVKKAVPKPALPWDDHRHRISWRGDGQCFVTSVIDPDEGCRKLRIWSREAVLQCTGEIVDGMEHTLFWKPSGNLITCSQQANNKHQVIFFEKNGLPHGGFKLPFQPSTFVIRELLWNIDSTILALWGYETVESASKNFCVMLWTVSNYQWYLKHRLNFTPEDPEVLNIFWDQNNMHKLHILCKGGHYYQYTWGWTVFHSHGQAENNAVAAVINGDEILVTAFGKMIIPPPMSSQTLKIPCPANGMCFSQYNGTADFVVDLADGKIALFRQSDSGSTLNNSEKCNLNPVMNGDHGFQMPPELIIPSGLYSLKSEGIAEVETNVSPYHWTWFSEDELLCIRPQRNCSSCVLLSIKLLAESDCLTMRKLAIVEAKVTKICAREGGSDIAIILQDGRVLKYKDEQLMPWICDSGRELSIPRSCSSVALCSVHGQDVLLALSDRFDLFCNETVLASRCTSFHIHGNFLLITTCDNTLQCFFKSNDADMKKGNYFQTINQASQRIEKGSRIVRTIPGRTEVILQAPRGNIETVHSRLLVLSMICQHLDSSKFGEAFVLMKKHRINMNMLYDHNSEKFLNCIDMVIDQLGSSADINLFLASLTNADISNTMYQMVYKVRPRPSVNVLDVNKVNAVCDAMRCGLEKKNDNKLFQAIVTCHAKKHPSEVDQALLKIKELKDSHKNGETSATADGALKLLLCLVDASELYKDAVGTYNFEIALMVAEKSQMDPKQYIPFLNELRSLEENYRKYKIDMELNRYKKALLHISKCSDHFDECLDLIKSQRLYKEALHLFPTSSDHYKAVWQSYGNYLMEKRYYDDAGLAYTKSEDHEKALSAYHLSLDLQHWLWTLKKLNYPALKNIMLCRDMAEKLKQNQRYLDAATILESYVEDIEESIITLIEGQEWGNALRLMAKYNRTDIIETHLHSALKEQYESLSSSLHLQFTDFCSHNLRLKIIRDERQSSTFLCSDFTDHHGDDLFSDTSSVSNVSSLSGTGKQLSGSLMTAKTGRSRRKKELKKYRLKEGSPNEDLAHIAALSDIITKVDKMKENFHSTLKTLVMFDLDSKAEDLQQKMRELCETIEVELPNIWPSHQTPQGIVNYGPASTSNSIVADVLEKKTYNESKECEIPKPDWHSNIPLSLTFLR